MVVLVWLFWCGCFVVVVLVWLFWCGCFVVVVCCSVIVMRTYPVFANWVFSLNHNGGREAVT